MLGARTRWAGSGSSLGRAPLPRHRAAGRQLGAVKGSGGGGHRQDSAGHSLVGELGGVLYLLGQGVAVASCAGADGVHARLAGEVVAPRGDKVDGGPHLKVAVQVEEIVQQV